MRLIAIALLAWVMAATALAQGVYVEPLPSVKPLPLGIAPPANDGKVNGLNPASYDAFAAIKQRNPRGFNEKDAAELQTALRKDGKIDDVEADMLREMIEPRTRTVWITKQGAAPDAPKLMVFSLAGLPRKIMFDTLNPMSDLHAHYAKGQPGWNALVTAARTSPDREKQVTDLLVNQMSAAWTLSNAENKYKPFSDLIVKLTGWASAAKTDPDDLASGRILIFRAAKTLDREQDDKIYDFYYDWVRPKA